MGFEDLTIIIPTLNEVETIRYLIPELKSLYPNAPIIISDDGSKDGTREYANSCQGVALIDRGSAPIHGLTASVLDAFDLASTKYCVVMDGDLQHPPAIVGKILKSLENGNDLVVAVRRGEIEGWSFERHVISFGATALGNLRLFFWGGKSNSDILSGFFGVRIELAEKVSEKKGRFALEGYKVLFDILKQLPSNCKIDEVPYQFRTRGLGRSKIRLKHIWLFFFSIFK